MAEEQKTEEELNEEAQLAKEALDATPDDTPAEKPEVDPKDAVIGEFRRELRETRRELADVKAAQTKTVEKSPLELAREQANIDGLTVEFTPELYEAQRKWEQNQSQAKSEEEIYARQKRDYDSGMVTLPVVEREELIAVGGHLLTEGDKQNIWDAGKNSGKELKRILTFRIKQAGLQSEIKEKEDKPKKETPETEETKEKKEEAPQLEEVFDNQTERAYQCFLPKKK